MAPISRASPPLPDLPAVEYLDQDQSQVLIAYEAEHRRRPAIRRREGGLAGRFPMQTREAVQSCTSYRRPVRPLGLGPADLARDLS